MTYITRVTDLIGGSPILELPIFLPDSRLLLKIEKTNPSGSMKDRMAINMVLDAIKQGQLKPGGTIVESSSGNTGIGLAIIAAEMGYRFIAVVDHHAAPDKLSTMAAFGAELRFVEGQYEEDEVAVVERQETAARLAREIPGAVFMNQSDNPANPAGYAKLAEEIFMQTNGTVDVLVGCTGTGGSLSGTSRKLRTLQPAVKTVGVEPYGSIIFGKPGRPYYQSGTGTPEGDKVGKVLDYTTIDIGLQVNDTEAFETARYLARRKGLLVGGSSGGAIYKALELSFSGQISGIIMCIVADGGEKYLNTIFNDEWMVAKDLVSPDIHRQLDQWLAPTQPAHLDLKAYKTERVS